MADWFDQMDGGIRSPRERGYTTNEGDVEPQPGGADPFAYTDGSLLTPWTKTFEPHAVSYSAPAYTPFQYADMQYEWMGPKSFEAGPAFQKPADFNYEGFRDTNAGDLASDPGYAFRQSEARKQLETSAASRGMLRHANTLEGLLNRSQDLASQEFGNVDSRRRASYATNRGNAAENYDRNFTNAFNVHQANEGNRRSAFDSNTGAQTSRFGVESGLYDRGYSNARTKWQDDANNAAAQASAANASASSAEAARRSSYNEEKGNFLDNQDRQFSRLVTMAQLGNPDSYASNMGNLITGQGNAQAAGQIGSSNAWTNALGGVANAAMGAGSMWYGGGGGGRQPSYSGMPSNGYPWA